MEDKVDSEIPMISESHESKCKSDDWQKWFLSKTANKTDPQTPE